MQETCKKCSHTNDVQQTIQDSYVCEKCGSRNFVEVPKDAQVGPILYALVIGWYWIVMALLAAVVAVLVCSMLMGIIESGKAIVVIGLIALIGYGLTHKK